MITLWQRENNHDLTLHDPLALMSVFVPDVIAWEHRRLEVGLCGENRGKTFIVDGEPNVRVAVEVDAARVVEMFIRRVSQILHRVS
jgi:inosine-uridine nucleoside N-ribohydrolase